MLKHIITAMVAVFILMFLGGVAHAGPLHEKTMKEYLKANDLDLASARKMKPQTLSKGGFTCNVYKGHWVSHCVEDYLVAAAAKTTARAAISASTSKRVVAPASKPQAKAVAPKKEVTTTATKTKDMKKPLISDRNKIRSFWVFGFVCFLFGAGCVVGLFALVGRGSRGRSIGSLAP